MSIGIGIFYIRIQLLKCRNWQVVLATIQKMKCQNKGGCVYCSEIDM